MAEKKNESARQLSKLGASKGGKSRAKALTSEERSAIARKAAAARWKSDIPIAEYEGEMAFGELTIPCAVLSDGTRLLSERGVTKGFGLGRAGSNWQGKKTGARMPVFASANNLKPFISSDLRLALESPVLYKPRTSKGVVAYGLKAELIPQICDVWLNARDAGAIKKQQAHIAIAADLIMRGLAKIGIIALVDEATGYQRDRARDALAQILEKFISKELCSWAKTFPDEYFDELSRLKGVTFGENGKRPQWVGRITNNVVYDRLAPGVTQTLQDLTPKTKKGNRSHKFHQRLTPDDGHPKLKEHLASVVALMKAADDWDAFKKMIDRALPKHKKLPLFDSP